MTRFEGDYYEIAAQVREVYSQIEFPDLDTSHPFAPSEEVAAEYARLAHATHELGSGYAALATEVYRMEYERLGRGLREAIRKGYLRIHTDRISAAQMEDISVSLVTEQWDVSASIVAGATGDGIYPKSIREIAGQIALIRERIDICENMTREFRRVV